MITLYRNYTVVVQTSTAPYLPNNTLQLFLYEGRLEMKTNTGTGKKDVFNYGTTILATPVYDTNGVSSTALAADVVNRPGEYDFLSLDLNKNGSLSYLGQTLYSVVARPAGDTDFGNARVIVDSTDISDPNNKQFIRSAIGSTGSLTDNVTWAGGTVAFEQYTGGAVTNNSAMQHLSLLNMPDVLTHQFEAVATAPAYAGVAGPRLIARFDVHYSDTTVGANTLVWEAVPAFKTPTGKWVIQLTNDQYSTYRSAEMGSGMGQIDISGIFQQFIVSVNLQENNVYIRRFDNLTPQVVTALDVKEQPILNLLNVGGEHRVGIGNWFTSPTDVPAYNLDIRGQNGIQYASNTTTKLKIGPTDSRIGYSCETGALTCFLGTISNAYIYIADTSVIAASAARTLISTDTTSDALPFSRVNSVYATLGSSGGASAAEKTYLRVGIDTGTEVIYGDVNISGTATRMLSMTPTDSRFGLSVGGGMTDGIQFLSSLVCNINSNSLTKIAVAATTTRLAYDASTWPILVASNTIIAMEADTYTYFKAYNPGAPTAAIYYNVSSSPYLAFVASSANGVIIGDRDITGAYLTFNGGVCTGAIGAATMLVLGHTFTKLGYDITAGNNPLITITTSDLTIKGPGTTYPYFYLSASYCYLYGTAHTFLKIDNANDRFTVNTLLGAGTAEALHISQDECSITNVASTCSLILNTGDLNIYANANNIGQLILAGAALQDTLLVHQSTTGALRITSNSSSGMAIYCTNGGNLNIGTVSTANVTIGGSGASVQIGSSGNVFNTPVSFMAPIVSTVIAVGGSYTDMSDFLTHINGNPPYNNVGLGTIVGFAAIINSALNTQLFQRINQGATDVWVVV